MHLDGDRELIASRIAQRQHHYMPASLLESQCELLEVPSADENALVVSITPPVQRIVGEILRRAGGALPPARPAPPGQAPGGD